MMFRVVIVLACALCVAEAKCSLEAEASCSAEAARRAASARWPAELVRAVPRLLGDLERTLQLRWPGCKAVLFGSTKTGLALANNSDVDVCILLPHTDADVDTSPKDLVAIASNLMEQHPETFYDVRALFNQTKIVPIVKANHVPTGFAVDVSFNPNGVRNSNVLRYLLNLDERALNLALIVKLWAALLDFKNAKLMTNYALTTMVIFYLQQKEILPAIAPLQINADTYYVNSYWNTGFTEETYETKNNESLCALLGDYFRYYTTFNFNKYMISPFVGRPIPIDLFKNVKKVPDEFKIYKTIVGSNKIQPIQIRTPYVQDVFEHAKNLFKYVDKRMYSEFETQVQLAASKFQENCTDFLETILPTIR